MDAQRRKESKGLGLLIIHCRHGHQWQGSSLAIFFQWHQTAIASFSFFPFLSFFFFKLLVFASEKKGLFVCFGDRWFKRWGKDPEKRVHRKTNRSCGLDRGF